MPAALQREIAETWWDAGGGVVAGASVAPGVASPLHSRRIRVGYMSGNFSGQHTLMMTHLLSVFGLHDAARFEVFCYALGRRSEGGSLYRKRVEADCEHTAAIHKHTTDEVAATRIAGDDLDVLVDLDGYATGGRPEILAFRPARTTGARFMDFVVTDCVASPPRLAHLYSERLAYLPHTYMVTEHRQSFAGVVTANAMAPGARDAQRAAAGLPPQPAIVFCAFHGSWELTSAVFSAWMEILRRVPGSALWLLKAKADSVQATLRAAAAAAGVTADRIVFARRSTKMEHLQRTALADIFLDAAPYNAGGHRGRHAVGWRSRRHQPWQRHGVPHGAVGRDRVGLP